MSRQYLCHRGWNSNNVAGTSNITLFCAGYEGECYFLGHKKETTTILVTREEDQWGLRLYFGEVGASKMYNFDTNDEVVVCLMREFIDDSKLPGDGARQHQEAAQAQFCLIRRHLTYAHSPTSIATAPIRLRLNQR